MRPVPNWTLLHNRCGPVTIAIKWPKDQKAVGLSDFKHNIERQNIIIITILFSHIHTHTHLSSLALMFDGSKVNIPLESRTSLKHNQLFLGTTEICLVLRPFVHRQTFMPVKVRTSFSQWFSLLTSAWTPSRASFFMSYWNQSIDVPVGPVQPHLWLLLDINRLFKNLTIQHC